MAKRKKTALDPNAANEAEKYANPIASREFLLTLLEDSTGPLTHRKVAELLNIDDDDALEALRRRLIAMERDGQIISNRKGAYGKIDKMQLVRGIVQGHRDGFGFVIPASGSDDIYLTNRQMRRVFDGDEVLVRVSEDGFRGRKEGAIVEVVSHNTQQVVGRFYSEKGVCFVRPDNPRLVQDVGVPADHTAGARKGQFVVVDILEQPGRRSPPVGHVAEILGEHLAPGMEIDVAIRNHAIPHTWPDEAASEAQALPEKVAEADKKGRFDLRDLPLVTIDGEDARDFDDAVYCERKRAGGWRLFVAIADVSHYVKVQSALDEEAVVRGNSVYFPDHVVPMFPEKLSNGLCSLKPKVDRLCMVCEMTVSTSGKISGYHFYEAVMHSHARLTYTQVGQMLAERGKKNSGIRKQFGDVITHIDELHELYRALRKTRDARGAIDFETTETRILFDENRKIERIVPVQRNDAHKLIEECMLAANVCAAKLLETQKMPALFRVHEGPKERKLTLLKEYLSGLGIRVPAASKLSPSDYQSVLEQTKDRTDAHIIQTVMLRSMNQAVYQPDNQGHFGLAYKAYAHFTSPIRRYPDLLVHRAIRSLIRSRAECKRIRREPKAKVLAKKNIYPYGTKEMLALGEQFSLTERRADEATRDVISWLKCEYLKDRVGETFDGIVASVVSFGLFVELKDLYVEGLVHVTSLPQDYYRHEPARHCLLGQRTGRSFSLGDAVSVQVLRVDLDERKVDLDLAETKPSKNVKKSAKKKSKAKPVSAKTKEKKKPKAKKPRPGKNARKRMKKES